MLISHTKTERQSIVVGDSTDVMDVRSQFYER